MEIITNNVPRDLICWHDLTPEEREDFDYIEDKYDERLSPRLFRYKGEVYDLHEFELASDSLKGWDGYQADTYFSGVLVKYTKDYYQIIAGRYYGG